MKDGIDSVQNLVDTNSSILEKLEEINADLPDALKEAVSGRIAELQAQNEEFQTLLDSLSQSNASMGNAMDTAQSTKEQLETLVSQSRQSRGITVITLTRRSPQLNESWILFLPWAEKCPAALSGVSASTDQLKGILSQLGTSLEDSSKALGRTGDSVTSLKGQIGPDRDGSQALQSSEAYQQFLSLEGLDADSMQSLWHRR